MALGEEILLTECIHLDAILFWLCSSDNAFNIPVFFDSTLAAGWLLMWICVLASICTCGSAVV